MARESDISFPLRLTGYFGFDSECELTFLVEREDDLALTRRLDHKTYLLTRNYTWRNLQNTLEQEAISTISVKEHLSKLYNIAKELSGISSESVDRSAVLLLHLFLQESLASTLLKGIMKHVFGFDVSSIILHRIYKIVHELKNSLPSYTLEHFLMENKCQGRRNGMFGGDICFVYLDRNTVVNSNTTVLCDIKLSEENKFDIEELEGTDDLSDDSSDTAPSSLTDLHPFNKMMCYRFDDDDHEEVRFQLIPKYLYKFDFCIPVSELNEMIQCVFEHKHTLNGFESTVYKSLFDSHGNILINLPLAYDKTTLIVLAILSVIEHNCDFTQNSKVLYLVPSIETAEYMALQLKRYLKPIQINVAHFTNSAELNYIKVNAVQVIVTTASLWEMKDLDYDSCPIKMLIVDEMNCLGEKNGSSLEVIIARMLKKLASGLDVRIMGFTISLLSVHCGPSFCDLAEYLQVDKNNALILSEYYMPMLPYVSVIKMKQSHYEKCQKYIAYICESAITGENKKKVVVFVKNKDDVFEIAKSIQNSLDTFQSKFLTLPDSVMVNLMNLMKAQGTDNVSMFLCLQGYLTLHAELSEHVRNYLYMIFKMGLAKIMVATSNYAPMLSDQADTVIVKDIDFYNKKKNPSTHEISSVVQMLAVAITSKKCRRNVIFIVDTEKFDTYQSILQNQSDVKSQLLYVIPDVLNNEIVANNVIDVTDCEKWFRHTFLFYNMLKKSKLLHIFDNLDAEVHHLMSEVLKALEECEMIKYPWKGHFIATDLNNVAHCHQVSYITLAFIGKYAETFLDENSIIDILCNAPVFSSFVMAAAQDNEFSTLADNFSIKKCGNWEIITLLKSSLCGIVSPRLETDQIYIIQEFKRLIRIMFEMYLTKKNAVMAERCMQLACTVEKCWRKANNIPEKFPTLIFEGCPQLISKVVLKVNFLIRPNSSWKMEVNDSRHLFWLWVVDVRNNIIQNYTCVELTQNIIEEEKNLIVSLPMKVTKPFRSQCKAYLLSCKSWEWVFTCTIPFHQIILPNDTPSYTELLKLHRLPVSVLQNYVLEKQFSSLLFSPFITQAFHSLYHSDCNVLLTCTVEDLITAAEIAVFRALSRNPGAKVVYVTKWKSEVEKRFNSWKNKFEKLGRKVIAFLGKTEDIDNFVKNDIVLTTACHWELASRSRQIRRCLASAEVSLIVVNDLHLLDADMEAALLRILASPQHKLVRVLGLSPTSIACSDDIIRFLRISPESPRRVYNFGHYTDSMMLNKVEVLGFSLRDFSTRSRAMSLSVWDIIQNVQTDERVIVLVPSREEVLATGMALKKFISNSLNPDICKCWEDNVEDMMFETQDINVSDLLKLGIGLLESGMSDYDCNIIHTIWQLRMIRILIMNMDVAGSLRIKNHLIIVKGTEVFDTNMGIYVDVPVPEIVNKMYSCGGNWKKAIILTSHSKECLFRAHFQGPLLLESELPGVLVDHINSEIAEGVINTKESAARYLQHSFFAHRVTSNPCFYHMGEMYKQKPEKYLTILVNKSLLMLEEVGCIIIKDSDQLQPTMLGLLSSKYGLSYVTMKVLSTNLKYDITICDMLIMVCNAKEFKKLPFRNEDKHLKWKLKNQCRWPVDLPNSSPLVEKVFILIQSHFSKAEKVFPNSVDYESDLKEVVDIALKIIQVVVLISCYKGWLRTALYAQRLQQMLVTGCWGFGTDSLFTLPHVTCNNWKCFLEPYPKKSVKNLRQLQQLYNKPNNIVFSALREHFLEDQVNQIGEALRKLPKLNFGIEVCRDKKCWKIKSINSHSCNTNLVLYAGIEYILAVELQEAENEIKNSWTLIFGSREKKEVLAMQRVTRGTKKSLMKFRTPEEAGEVTYTLFLLPNNYIGIDQLCNVYLEIVCK